jgi:hypothetical protein
MRVNETIVGDNSPARFTAPNECNGDFTTITATFTYRRDLPDGSASLAAGPLAAENLSCHALSKLLPSLSNSGISG